MTPENEPHPEKIRPLKSIDRLISPVVARLAHENRIDIHRLQGSGKGGRITKQDVLDAIQQGTAPLVPALPPGAPSPAALALTVDLNRMERSLLAWNEQHIDQFPLTPIAGILAAALSAISAFPQLSTPAETPLIHLVRPGAPVMSLSQIAADEPLPLLTASLPQFRQEPAGSAPTFIIEDHSLTEMELIFPALPQGQHALLAIGSLQRRPVAVTNTMVVHPVVQISLVYAPHQLSAIMAADFLTRLKSLVEQW